jgi:hypothetical protein
VDVALLDRFSRIADISRLNDAYKATFTSPDGDLVLKHLMKTFNVYKPTFTTDPATTAFREGQRHVVLSILRFVCRDKEQIKKYIEEGLTNE